MGGFCNMKHEWNGKRFGKGAALVGAVALCLTLTGCYIPPDEIAAENMTIGGNNLPFDTFDTAVPSTNPPTPTPTQTPGQAISQPTVNWDDYWGDSTTNVPSASSPVGVVTNRPSTNTIAVVTQKPTDTPAPTTSVLKKGASGTEVRQVQQRLKTLGYLSGSADGDFGDLTEAAVMAFQSVNGLYADGIVGKNTLNKLNSNSAVSNPGEPATVTKTPSSSSATRKPTVTAKPTATPKVDNVYLEVGSSGTKVKTLQQRLISLGWMSGTADGKYGGATQAAVKAFQKKMGLWADGIAGPDTLEKLYSSSAKSSSTPASSVGETLEEGMKGDAVRSLQKRLKELGYLSGSVDGSFGSATKTAVIAFQRNNGLTADGKAGTATLNKIYEEEPVKESDTKKDDDSEISSTGYVVLREGSTGDAVRKLQQTLKQLGYYSGSVDGSFGSGTTSAVQAFQRANDLRVDGAAGPATQRALYGTSSSITYATLREGDTGSAVKNLQYALYELGYYDGKLDSTYGSTTSDAVRAFQIQNSISPVDGIAGNKTLQMLYSSSAKAAAAATTEYETLREGSRGSAVVEMQECLAQLGYLADVTGVYDSATVSAVKAFQRNNGLSVDGAAGNDTLKKLYSNSAKGN